MTDPTTVFYDPTKTFDDNFDNGPFTDDDHPFKNTGEPRYSFLGHSVYSPFGIPAGPLPTVKHVRLAFQKGFDVVCYKTQRSIPFPANAFPNIVYLEIEGDLTPEKADQPIVGRLKTNMPANKLTITNSFGNPSRGPEFWVEDMEQAIAAQGRGQLLVCSVVGTIQAGFTPLQYYEDFAYAAELAARAGAKAIEINLSCPNVANEGILCYTPAAVQQICKLTKERIGDIPLIAKLGYFSSAQFEILKQIVLDNKAYLAAYSVINTLPVTVVDEKGAQLLPGPGRLKSGACGAGIKWAGLEMVQKLVTLREETNQNFEIIGVGGVMSVDDFRDYRSAGAAIVQSATGAMWNINLATQIKQAVELA